MSGDELTIGEQNINFANICIINKGELSNTANQQCGLRRLN